MKRKRAGLMSRWTAAKKRATAAVRTASRAIRARPYLGVVKGYRGTVVTGTGPAPNRVRTILRYGVKVATDGALRTFRFNANSCNQVNLPAGGHQPLGWDQWVAFYNHYTVSEVKVTVKAITTVDAVIAMTCDNGGAVYSTLSECQEQKNAVWKLIPATYGQATLYKKYNLWNVNGIELKQYLADDRFSALTTGDPSEIIQIKVFMTAADGATILAANAATFHIKIDFVVDLYDVKQMAQS